MNAPASAGQRRDQARYIMIGGFLGAGKTTAVAALAERLTQAGLRVGLITNDQGSGLVDTATLRAKGFATEEIPGGCFCCRFNSLVDAAEKLDAASAPQIFIAEPVGSCTDLVATVSYPLRRIYGSDYVIAPLSVLVDPVRAERIFGLTSGGKFSEKVLYIYRKQLEEADLIVISKTDLLTAARLDALRARLGTEFPHAAILAVSVRDGTGLEEWFSAVLAGEPAAREAMEMDYDTYADGEALLGWLNATAELSASAPFDSEPVLMALARGIQEKLAGKEIAHLKMTLSPASGLADLAVINLVRSDFVPELGLRLEVPISGGQLMINLRAEAEPDDLHDAVREAASALTAMFPGMTLQLEHLEFFRPGRPQPTHRMSSANASA